MENSSNLFDAYYYAHGCGRPYERDDEWLGFFNGIAAHIAREIQPKTILDAGCALGFLVEGLRSRHIAAFGIDISEYAITHTHESIREYCRVGSIAEPFPQRYDLIVTIEVVEHMPEEEAQKAIANFCQYADDILFSSTPFDYKEATHLNVQMPEYWAEQFARHGFFRDVDFDASFITPWAVRFRKRQEPVQRIVRDYERRFWPLWKENQDMRQLVMEMRTQLTEMHAKVTEMHALEQVIRGQNNEIVTLTRQVNEMSDQILEWHEHWTNIQSGMTWRLLQAAIRLQPRLAPEGSLRLRMLQSLFSATRSLARRLRGAPAEPATPASPSAEPSPATAVPAVPAIASPESAALLKLALYSGDPWKSACGHLRLTGPAAHKGAGIQVLQGTDRETTLALSFPEEAEVVVIQREFPRREEDYQRVVAWARHRELPVVYELDDLLIELPPEHPEREYYAEARQPMLQALMEADAVIVSTTPLAEYARRFNANAWVLPNTLDDAIWPIHEKDAGRSSPLVIGYMGGVTKTHLPDIAIIQPVLIKLLREYGDALRLRFWGMLPPDFKDLPNVEFRSEKFASYPDFARYFSKQSCDIFVAPLRSSLFNRCKSPIKYIEYSSLGIPGVYSRIDPYESVVVHGANGFLAGGESEWEDNLRQLIQDARLRQRIGQAAAQTIRDEHRMSQQAHQWGTVYRAALATAPAAQTAEARALAQMHYEQWQRSA